jgi:hypothetical protein
LKVLGTVTGIEVALIGLCLLFPGAGHSPLLYTQVPAMVIVGWLSPDVGTCISCAPFSWLVGAFGEVLLITALIVLGPALLAPRKARSTTEGGPPRPASPTK